MDGGGRKVYDDETLISDGGHCAGGGWADGVRGFGSLSCRLGGSRSWEVWSPSFIYRSLSFAWQGHRKGAAVRPTSAGCGGLGETSRQDLVAAVRYVLSVLHYEALALNQTLPSFDSRLFSSITPAHYTNAQFGLSLHQPRLRGCRIHSRFSARHSNAALDELVATMNSLVEINGMRM